jgi:cytochrome c oxidase cbb3-type subunit 1
MVEDTTGSATQANLERQAIDASCRRPVLFYLGSSVFWLLIGSMLALIASFKLHLPDLMTRLPWMTFGRVRPAHLNVVGFGWGSMAAIGVAVWMMCRLSRAELRYPKVLLVAGVVWNIGIAVGMVGILLGHSTSVEWLEFPEYTAPILATSLLMAAACVFTTFFQRRERHVYVTQWYVLGAFFWMPLLYVTAVWLCLHSPAKGVVQASVNWWFAHNVLGLWVTPIGVGTAYYLIPKVIGRPVYSYYLSVIGFWSLALFYSWAGMHHLIGGPIPAWMVSASIVGSMMMIIPVGAVAINHHMTMKGHFHELRYSPTLRFVVFGAVSYTAVSLQGSIESLRSFSEVAHFTHYTVGHAHLGLYGFFTMTMFGAIYYIVPRLTKRDWGSPFLIRVHFWSTAIGVTLYFCSLSVGGWFQGLALLNPDIKFIEIVANTIPYLTLRSWAGSLMTLGHVIFALLLVRNILRRAK